MRSLTAALSLLRRQNPREKSVLEDEPDEGMEDDRDNDNAFDDAGGISGIYASDDEPDSHPRDALSGGARR